MATHCENGNMNIEVLCGISHTQQQKYNHHAMCAIRYELLQGRGGCKGEGGSCNFPPRACNETWDKENIIEVVINIPTAVNVLSVSCFRCKHGLWFCFIPLIYTTQELRHFCNMLSLHW